MYGYFKAFVIATLEIRKGKDRGEILDVVSSQRGYRKFTSEIRQHPRAGINQPRNSFRSFALQLNFRYLSFKTRCHTKSNASSLNIHRNNSMKHP